MDSIGVGYCEKVIYSSSIMNQKEAPQYFQVFLWFYVVLYGYMSEAHSRDIVRFAKGTFSDADYFCAVAQK
jgi:hypothetical protein